MQAVSIGNAPGPNSTDSGNTDRGKLGARHHLGVDRNGLTMAILNTAANAADCKMFIEAIDDQQQTVLHSIFSTGSQTENPSSAGREDGGSADERQAAGLGS